MGEAPQAQMQAHLPGNATAARSMGSMRYRCWTAQRGGLRRAATSMDLMPSWTQVQRVMCQTAASSLASQVLDRLVVYPDPRLVLPA